MRAPPSSGRTRSKRGAGGWYACRSSPAHRRRRCSRGCAARPRDGAPMKLLVATRNEGKIREIRDLFTGLPFQLTFPVDQFLERLPDEADLERGTSFAENAVAKARYFAKRGTIATLAEDSGLEVDALDGAPGVFSARWAQMHAAGSGDAANNALPLRGGVSRDAARQAAAGRGDVRGTDSVATARQRWLRLRSAVLLERSRAELRRGSAAGEAACVASRAGDPGAGGGVGAALEVANQTQRCARFDHKSCTV